MSMLGQMAIEGYIMELQKWIKKQREADNPVGLLAALELKLEEDRKAAKDGWL